MVTFDDEFRQVTEALQSHEATVDLAANAVNIAEAREARASQAIFQQGKWRQKPRVPVLT